VEKKQLLNIIKELESQQHVVGDEKKVLKQQCKILKQDLQKSQKKNSLYSKHQEDMIESIDAIELEISSYELNLNQQISKNEGIMVSNDIVNLEVTRLRDILRTRVTEILCLEEYRDNIIERQTKQKEEVDIMNEIYVSQMRAVEEERHKSAVELGQRSIMANKIKLKYEMLTKAHHTDTKDGDEGHSHVYTFITAAQKRAELQNEGDTLDREIRIKAKEIKEMRKTMIHLRERNTEFRKSFARVDMNSNEMQEMKCVDAEYISSEKELFNLKIEHRNSCVVFKNTESKLIPMKKHLSQIESDNIHLETTKKKIVEEIEKLEKSNSSIKKQINDHR